MQEIMDLFNKPPPFKLCFTPKTLLGRSHIQIDKPLKSRKFY